MLTRSAWAGMQRWGAALWSGDTSSHWPSLKVSIQAGLNTQLSGIAWWTTDIGGLQRLALSLSLSLSGSLSLSYLLCLLSFPLCPRLCAGYSGGNPSDSGFRELIVRW